MPITGYISVGLPIGPNAENDPTFVQDPKYGLGGLRTVVNTTARDAILQQRRQIGMLVYVEDENKYYSLVGGTGDAFWTEFISGSGSTGITEIYGTSAEIQVTGSGSERTIGLPDDVTITGNLNILGNINIGGYVLADGLIITKTAFQGFTGDDELEGLLDVSLDGGNY
jgi:hypothetical protein